MQQLDEICQYAALVCEQIRWKKAHSRVSTEIENHLQDQKCAFIASGLTESQATEKAISEMGDAVDIGTQLDRTHRPRSQWGMLLFVAVLLCLGFAIRFLLTGGQGAAANEIVAVIIGTAAMLGAYFTDFTVIRKFPKLIYFSLMALTIFMLLFCIKVNTRPMFLNLAPNAGIIVLLYPLSYAAIIYSVRNKGYFGIIISGAAITFSAFLMFLVPFGAGFVFTCFCGAALLLFAIATNWFNVRKLTGFLLVLVPTAIFAVAFSMKFCPAIKRTLEIALNPYADANGKGYLSIVIQSLLSGSQWIGRGTLPNSNMQEMLERGLLETDYILTNIIHSFGWLFGIAVIAVLAVFIIKGFIGCFKQKSKLGQLVSLSVMLGFSTQIFGYVLYNLGFGLFAPISLPFIAFGNVALVINMGLVGVMLSVFRIGSEVQDGIAALNNKRFITREGNKIIIDLKW